MSSMPTKGWNTQLRELVTSPLVVIAMTCMIGYFAYIRTFRQTPTYDDEDYEQEGHVELPIPLSDLKLNLEELAKYGCNHPDSTYLVALHGILYDVSSAPHDFGPDGKFHMLSGTDIGKYIENTTAYDSRDKITIIKEWKIMLEDYFYVAGILVDEPEESKSNEEQQQANVTLLEDNIKKVEEEEEEEKKEQAEVVVVQKEEVPVPEPTPSDDNDSLRTAYDCLNDKEDENESIEMGQGDGNSTISNRSIYNDAGDDTLVWNETDQTVVGL